jgi:glycine/D-amino acid oxidase-like deaminating enzyme
VHTDAYFIPKGGETLIGKLGTMENDLDRDPESYDRGVSNQELDRFRRSGRHRLPFLDRGTVLGGWAGLYDDSVDAHPIIDAVPGTDGLFCALGMSGNCFKLSPVLGDLIAERVIAGTGSAAALEQFRFDRFEHGAAHDRAFGSMSVLA